MKNFPILSFILFLLLSCSRIGLPENQKVYYKFTTEDYRYIPDKYAANIGGITTYKSSTNEEIKLKTESYGLSENNYLSGQYFGKDYYYDRIGMTLKFLNSSSDCASIGVGIEKYKNNEVAYEFNVMGSYKFFNGGCGGITKPLNLPKDLGNLQSMTINNITYNYVYIIDFIGSYNEYYLTPDFQFDKIYFDLKQGLIGIKNAKNQETYWIQP